MIFDLFIVQSIRALCRKRLKKSHNIGYQTSVNSINEYKTITIMILLILASLICFVIVKILFTDGEEVGCLYKSQCCYFFTWCLLSNWIIKRLKPACRKAGIGKIGKIIGLTFQCSFIFLIFSIFPIFQFFQFPSTFNNIDSSVSPGPKAKLRILFPLSFSFNSLSMECSTNSTVGEDMFP